MKGAYKHTVSFAYEWWNNESAGLSSGRTSFAVEVNSDEATPFSKDTFFAYMQGKILYPKGLFSLWSDNTPYQIFFARGANEKIDLYGANTANSSEGVFSINNPSGNDDYFDVTDFVTQNT